jgi:hypothetical protein
LGFILSDVAEVRYSEGEKRLFKLLPQNGRKVTTRDLASTLHRRVINGRVRVVGTLSSLMTKTQLNREPFKIKREARNGPHPVAVWIERKGNA